MYRPQFNEYSTLMFSPLIRIRYSVQTDICVSNSILSWDEYYGKVSKTTQDVVVFIIISTFKDSGHYCNCQRPVFLLGVSQHYMHKILNLWKFELNWSSKFRDINERKNTELCAFRCLISRSQILNLRSRNQIRGK